MRLGQAPERVQVEFALDYITDGGVNSTAAIQLGLPTSSRRWGEGEELRLTRLNASGSPYLAASTSTILEIQSMLLF